jgi:DNA repair protein RadC
VSADHETPRDRLLRAGAGALTDSEILAVLMGGGRSRVPTDTAYRMVKAAGGLPGVAGSVRYGFSKIPPPQRAALLAALELSVRLARAKIPERAPLNRPAAVAAYVLRCYGTAHQETGGALFLNARNRLIGEREIFAGSLRTLPISPAPILTEALTRGAAGVAVWHFHPSGVATPSVSDLTFTEKLRKAADLVGLVLVDHLIVAAPGVWVSLRERCGW